MSYYYIQNGDASQKCRWSQTLYKDQLKAFFLINLHANISSSPLFFLQVILQNLQILAILVKRGLTVVLQTCIVYLAIKWNVNEIKLIVKNVDHKNFQIKNALIPYFLWKMDIARLYDKMLSSVTIYNFKILVLN